MEVPSHIGELLGLQESASEGEVLDALQAQGALMASLGLPATEAVQALVDESKSPRKFQLIEISQVPSSWRHLEISLGTDRTLEAAILSKDYSESPPTATSRLMLKAWIQLPSVLRDGQIPSHALLIAQERSGNDIDVLKGFARNWASQCYLFDNDSNAPLWVLGSQVVFNAKSKIFEQAHSNVEYAGLFLELASESKAKWRFLSQYRILEHGYLMAVSAGLQKDFLRDPLQAVNTALKDLGSEFTQLTRLAELADLRSEFEQIFDIHKKHVKALNRFACAIDTRLPRDPKINSAVTTWRMGVAVYYKLRNAIVHSGLSDPFIEGYVDSFSVLDDVLKVSESLVLKYLGISIPLATPGDSRA